MMSLGYGYCYLIGISRVPDIAVTGESAVVSQETIDGEISYSLLILRACYYSH